MDARALHPPLRIFLPEHQRVLEAYYGRDSDGYSSLLESLGSALERDVAPLSAGIDAGSQGIARTRAVAFRQGVPRIPFDSHGGLSLPFGVYCLAMEMVASADAPTAMSVGIHDTVAEGLNLFGSESQKNDLLESLLSGRRLASFCLTEPSSGSDASKMSTIAARRGDEYVLNGTKTFITNAGDADVYLVFAKTGEEGHSAFLVDGSTPGLSFGPDIPKLGMRGSRTSEVRLQDCRVGVGSLLGVEGRGLDYAKAMLNASRVVMGAVCVGIALTAYGRAVDYAKQRSLFGRALADMQMTREKVATMRSEITSARATYLFASRLKDAAGDYSSEAAQSKVIATEMACRVCDQTIQIFGGYGYTSDDVHRHWRDARLLTIGEGASEVLRLLISNKELGHPR